MKRLLYLAVTFWVAATGVRATNVVLNSSYPPSEDSVTINIKINSAINPLTGPQAVAPGLYHLHFGPFVDTEFRVAGDGKIVNSGYYGLTANFTGDYSITFTWTYANNLWEFRDGWGDYDPPYNEWDLGQPPGEFYNDTQTWNLYVEGPIPDPPATANQFWNQTVTAAEYFFHDWVAYGAAVPGIKLFYTGDSSGNYLTRPPQSFVRNFSVQLPPPTGLPAKADQSPPGGCSSCAACSNASPANSHMAGYSFDGLRGSLRVTDTPASYSSPIGPGMAFTITYNQGDVGQESLPFLANMGNQFTYSYLSYISNNPTSGDVTRFVPGGGVEYYPNFNIGNGSDLASSGNVISDPERNSRAVLSWDNANQRYIRTLPDGSSQIYGQAATDPNNVPLFLISSETDAQGNTVSYGYDSLNRLVTITDAIGQVTTLSYANGDQYKITKVTDPFGRSAKFQYDSQGRLTSSTDALGIVSNFAYDGTNFLNQLTTPYGTTAFTTDSDALHHGVNATNPLSQTERIELRYNSVSTISDTDTVPSATGIQSAASGLSSGNTYYWTRRQYSPTPDYTKATITHWMNGPRGLTNIVDSTKKPLEGRVWYNYQGQAQADYIADEASASTTITARLLDSGATQASYATYNSTGMITQSVDPLGRTTNYTYDTNGIDLLTVTQTHGTGQDLLSTVTYNSQHEPLTVTDASGQVATMTYNGQGQLLSRTVVVGGNNQITTMTYAGPTGSGSGNYLTLVTGPVSGATTSYTYDGEGRVHTVTDSEGYALTMAYDNLDRPTTTTYPDGTTDQTFYKILDVAKTVDRQGRATTNQYDAIRELLQTTDPLNRTTKYSWCTCGGLSTLTDANGNVTTWNLDIMGRVTGKVYADGSQISYTYENNTSRLASMTDADGNSAAYTYNLDNTLSGTTYDPASGMGITPNVSFTYDPIYNRVLSMTDGTGTTNYSYNPITGSVTTGAGRLSSVSVPIAGSSATVAYTYDELGRVTGRSVDGTTTNANNVSTTFDALGRVTNVSNPLGAFIYAYVDETSRLSEVTYPNGQKTDYSYFGNTGDQRLQEIKNYVWGMISNTPLSKFDYTYNSVGTIATWTQQADNTTAVVNTLSYDNADQLTSAVQSGGGTASNAYNYDPAGNRLAETTLTGTTAGQFNNLNQLTGLSGITTAQTVAGNTTAAVSNVTINAVPANVTSSTNFTASVPLPAGTNTVSVVAQPATGPATTKRYQIVTTGTAATALTYDANGNTLTDENGNTYNWDGLNRLIRITYPSTAYSAFAYDGLSRRIQIVEHDATGSHTVTSTKNFLWIGSEIAEERDGSNTVTKRFFPQGEQQAGTNYYYTRDHLGSVRELCSSTGTIVSRMAYDPYGRTTTVSGTILPTMQYAGYYQHEISGIDLTYFRAYDSNRGQWLSRDPYGESAGLNLYDYVKNRSVGAIDPFGLMNHIPKPGDFDITITPDGTSNSVQITYTKPANSCCKTIKIIQSISWYGGPWGVDYVPGIEDSDESYPYYQYQQQGGSSVTSHDDPGLYIRWTHIPYAPGYLHQEFMTCAVCVETGDILGCIRWSSWVYPWGAYSSGSHQNVPGVPMDMPF